MRTLKELQKQMRDGSSEEKLAAAMEVANFNFVYNQEYNALLNIQASAEVAHFDATRSKAGIDHVYRLELEALKARIEARKSFLDLQMMEFHASRIGIEGPDEKTIDTVKKMTDKVARQVLKDTAVRGIIAALSDIAALVNGTMSKTA
jgi:hypothetical protein